VAQESLLASRYAAQRASKPLQWRHQDAVRKQKRCLDKQEKSVQALKDIDAEHEKVLQKHRDARALAESVLAADKLLTSAANQELADATAAAAAAAALPPPIVAMSAAAAQLAEVARVANENLAAQMATDQAAQQQAAVDTPAGAGGPPLPADPPLPEDERMAADKRQRELDDDEAQQAADAHANIERDASEATAKKAKLALAAAGTGGLPPRV
jgi:hypothetical protein